MSSRKSLNFPVSLYVNLQTAVLCKNGDENQRTPTVCFNVCYLVIIFIVVVIINSILFFLLFKCLQNQTYFLISFEPLLTGHLLSVKLVKVSNLLLLYYC